MSVQSHERRSLMEEKERGRKVDEPHKLVPLIRQQIHHRPLISDPEQITSELDAHKFEQQQPERLRGGLAEDSGVETTGGTGDDGGEEDVGDEGHDCGRGTGQ
jgi:hypothetical protein